jgi:hypothetical protein
VRYVSEINGTDARINEIFTDAWVKAFRPGL